MGPPRPDLDLRDPTWTSQDRSGPPEDRLYAPRTRFETPGLEFHLSRTDFDLLERSGGPREMAQTGQPEGFQDLMENDQIDHFDQFCQRDKFSPKHEIAEAMSWRFHEIAQMI